MFAITCLASAPNWSRRVQLHPLSWRATTEATTRTPAPKITTIHVGNTAAAPNAKPIPITWKSAPPACDRPLP